ncbi:zeta toxin family protein [Paraburkholderia sp. DGU8]|uniref:zeta toxin family protein n=1 Tax=Paraburkholderia sp. DGU8 TaxID=3161997 RepID=UPI003467BFFA
MPQDYRRRFESSVDIEWFLANCLGLVGDFKLPSGRPCILDKVVEELRNAEAAVEKVGDRSTYKSPANRYGSYRDPASRQRLRETILEELWTLDRLADDEDIKLGTGGAQPIGRPAEKGFTAYIVTGLPASGKSTMVNQIADQLGAVIVDSDYAKRKFPEFDNNAGAQLVHEESAIVTEGGEVGADGQQVPSLLGACTQDGINVVMPKIGHNPESLIRLQEAFLHKKYQVHLTTVELTRREATMRALHRFCDTGRYVPLGLIFDHYANDPALTYYKFRAGILPGSTGWASFGAVSSKNRGYQVVDYSSEENPAALFRNEDKAP